MLIPGLSVLCRVWQLLQGEGEALDVAAVGADHGFELAGFADVFQVFVVELEQVGVDGEGDGAALAGFEADALKSLEFLHGTGNAAYHVADVELHNLGSLNFAGVDIMKKMDKDGKPVPYFIEINSNPGDMIIDVTGHNHYEDLLDYVERNCNRKQSGSSNFAMLDALKEAVRQTSEYKALEAKRLELFPDIYRNYREKGLL